MKHLLTPFLFLICLVGAAQPSYIDLKIAFDGYPGETLWIIHDNGELVAEGNGFDALPNSVYEETIPLESGVDYTFTIMDTFGDGICCGFGEGFFSAENECEGIIFEDFAFDTTQVDIFFNLDPCEIPDTGGGDPDPDPTTPGPTFEELLSCSDPSAINWNPWAMSDPGPGCIILDSSCPPGQGLIEIIVTPDVFGNEIGWILYGEDDIVYATATAGSYGGAPAGVPISTTVCLPLNQEYDIVVTDTYGDGMCASCATNNPDLESGDFEILDCNGTSIWLLTDEFEDANFGSDVTSAPFSPLECSGGVVDIEGCTDFDYLEYNPLAVLDDGSCQTEKVYGCMDPTQFNFNSEANTEEIIGSCEYTLTITDGVGDGWFGSTLGIWQFGYNSPLYQMGPNDGTELSFNLELDASLPASIYFFVTPQSINSAQQCGFTLANPDGEVIIEVPFFNIIPFVNESGWYKYDVSLNCGSICEPYIYGCTYPEAINYNNEANTDDESCVYSPGCTNPAYVEYSEEADLDDGSCLTLVEFGCTDPDAFNFEEEANTDNGTCVPKIFGCLNELAFNYNPLANTPDGSCIAVQEGCTNPEALNYNPEANTEDFSCVLPILGCTNPEAFNFNVLANTDDGTCIDVVFGCTDETAFNYNPLANTNVGCESVVEGCIDVEAINYDPQANTDNGSCIAEVFGCTDPTAFNYDENANIDNGSCVEVVFGCLDETALNFNPDANISNDNCIGVIEGCTNPLALNYNELANVEDGSCVDAIYGCTDPTAFNYNELANIDNESCIPVIEGCMDPLALNFDPLANVNNFECDLPIYGCTDTTAFNYNELATTDNGTCIPVIEGCMNPEALNFNADANVDDLSCVLPIYGCTDETALNYDENANTDNGTCIEVVEGCTNPEALNYNPEANVEDFSCIEAIYGCTDSTAFNYNELATVDNGSCIEIVEGCTDPTAFNYNPEANTENFSCEPFIYGCTDPQAANYDEEANTDNGTCETVYANCIDSVVETYNLLELESECFAWVIDVSPSCCNNEWADGCQTIYNYCNENTVTNIEEFGETQIIVFPNPTRDRINIASNLRINAVLYNSIGQPVLQEINVNQLDLNQFEAGIYNLILTYNDLKFTKKIVKQ